jgi:DNA-binding XRE family transcriptional regulator
MTGVQLKRATVADMDRGNPWFTRLKRFVTGPETMTGQELRALRKAVGLTQKELAKILGVTPLTIIRAERTKPSRAVISYLDRAMAKGLIQISEKKSLPEDPS